MNIAVDFDHTIHDPDNVEPGYRMGKPMEGAVDAVKQFKAQGHDVIIFTARYVNLPSVKKAVADWMRFFGIPFDDITNVKRPTFDVFIDDRAIGFVSWDDALRQFYTIHARPEWRD